MLGTQVLQTMYNITSSMTTELQPNNPYFISITVALDNRLQQTAAPTVGQSLFKCSCSKDGAIM